jgi:hypothetical protein
VLKLTVNIESFPHTFSYFFSFETSKTDPSAAENWLDSVALASNARQRQTKGNVAQSTSTRGQAMTPRNTDIDTD